MNILPVIFFIFIIAVIGVSMALFWHWKKFMPEAGKGAGVFTVYIIGLGVLILALFTTINNL